MKTTEIPLVEGEEVKYWNVVKGHNIIVTDRRLIIKSGGDYKDISIHHIASISITHRWGLFLLGILIIIGYLLLIAYLSKRCFLYHYGITLFIAYALYRDNFYPILMGEKPIPAEATAIATIIMLLPIIIGLIFAYIGWRNRILMAVHYSNAYFILKDGKKLEEIAIKIREYVEKVKVEKG